MFRGKSTKSIRIILASSVLVLGILLNLWIDFGRLEILTVLVGWVVTLRVPDRWILWLHSAEEKHTAPFRFCGILLIGLTNVFYLVTFSDFDSDGVVLHKERKAGLDYRYPDVDRDIMKDGVEMHGVNRDRSLFDPQNPDVNSNEICDFCDAIIRHKVKEEQYISGIVRENVSRNTLIDICDEVLNAKENFNFCWDIKSINDFVLLGMQCKDLVFAKIPDLRRKNYYVNY